MASLKASDLEALPKAEIVMDKFGVRYFKSADGTWISDLLEVTPVNELTKRRATIDRDSHI